MKRPSGAALPACLALLLCLGGAFTANAAPRSKENLTAWILTRDGQNIEGALNTAAVQASFDGRTLELPLREVLTLQTAAPATPQETEKITAGLAAISANTDRRAREIAVADLTDIGLPVVSPLLAAYKDTDLHEPNPLYRLFARVMPGYADQADRKQDLIRLANGEALRGQVADTELALTAADGKEVRIPISTVRRLAIRRKNVEKRFEVQALRHCSQIEFLDSGIGVTPASRIDAAAQGLVRLSFDIDGWASDPDGLKVPGPHYQTNLVDGFPFGALIGRVGPTGARWMAGRHLQKTGMEQGRLYFAVNDNGHWQNNIGSFRVRLRASDAYDLGDPQ